MSSSPPAADGAEPVALAAAASEDQDMSSAASSPSLAEAPPLSAAEPSAEERSAESAAAEELAAAAAAGAAPGSSSPEPKKQKSEIKVVAVQEAEEPLCRYCFDNAEFGPLLAPCDCQGGQKWVHMACLRRWQRMVLVSQPTHPSLWTRDKRHYFCNVCTGRYTCAPPERSELMASFTGPELASMLAPGFVIGSEEAFSTHLEQQLQQLEASGSFQYYSAKSSYEHWIRGLYIITEVEEDDGRITIELVRLVAGAAAAATAAAVAAAPADRSVGRTRKRSWTAFASSSARRSPSPCAARYAPLP